MTYTPIPIGSLAWGAAVNAGFTDQDSRITDMENMGGETINAMGFKAIPYDPSIATASITLTSGTIIMTRVDITSAETLSTLTATVFTVGAGLTAGQNFGALYTAAGTRVAVTADQSAAWTSTGEMNMAFTAPYAAAAGTYYLALLSNGATPVTISRSVNNVAAAGTINHGLTTSTGRFTTGPTAQTTMPASVTMASRLLSGTAYWMGVS